MCLVHKDVRIRKQATKEFIFFINTDKLVQLEEPQWHLVVLIDNATFNAILGLSKLVIKKQSFFVEYSFFGICLLSHK